jgi:RND family efflux transporter MFP subunit
MKKLLIFLQITLPLALLAGPGHDHADEQVKTSGSANYFSIENVSDKYELLLKYAPFGPGQAVELTLFVSDYTTNRPVKNLEISVATPDDPAQVFEISESEPGIFKLKTIFAAAKIYALNVTLKGGLGADLIQLGGIEPGKELSVHSEEVTSSHPLTSGAWTVLGMLLAFLAGMALTLMFARRRPKMAASALLALFFAGFPLQNLPNATAHGDEEHGEGNTFSAEILIPKETQFLFDVTTAKAGVDNFAPTITLFGTVTPGATGRADVQSPLAGTLRSLRVRVGESVRVGQVLAVVEQSVDAGTSINWQSERNAVEAEVAAAQKDFDRLNNLRDIIAKRDLDEAVARLQRAKENRDLFNRLYDDGAGKNARFIPLTAPIAGRVEPFTFAPGAIVNAGETLFTLLNPAKVIVEAQLYDKDADILRAAKNFAVECSNNDHNSRSIRLLAFPNSINPTNQSHKVLFEVDNPDGDFKIGEFVNVRIFEQLTQRQLLVPNSAITEISGVPAVFVKEHAEHYTVRYLKTGADNGTATVVEKGLEEGSRFVTTGTYQLKMVYFNQ